MTRPGTSGDQMPLVTLTRAATQRVRRPPRCGSAQTSRPRARHSAHEEASPDRVPEQRMSTRFQLRGAAIRGAARTGTRVIPSCVRRTVRCLPLHRRASGGRRRGDGSVVRTRYRASVGLSRY